MGSLKFTFRSQRRRILALSESDGRDPDQRNAALEQAKFARRFFRDVDHPPPSWHAVVHPDDHRTVPVNERHAHPRSHRKNRRRRGKPIVQQRFARAGPHQPRSTPVPRCHADDRRPDGDSRKSRSGPSQIAGPPSHRCARTHFRPLGRLVRCTRAACGEGDGKPDERQAGCDPRSRCVTHRRGTPPSGQEPVHRWTASPQARSSESRLSG